MPTDFLLLALCTLLGALLSRTSLCTVAGMQQCLRERSVGGLRPMLVATCTAGLGLMSFALLRPAGVVLPGQLPLGPGLLAGGALLGAGALLNGACYLGSLQYVGRGNANFLLTLLGLGLAARSASGGTMAGSPGRMPEAAVAMAGLAGFALLLWLLLRSRQPIATYAAAAAGIVASGIYAWHPAWSYGVVVESLVHARRAMAPGLLAACMLFVGATIGAVLQHRWKFAAFEPVRATRCLAGGYVMGWGAHLVPGGNDMLLLWALPGLAAYGLVAYLAMLVTLAALLGAPLAKAVARR